MLQRQVVLSIEPLPPRPYALTEAEIAGVFGGCVGKGIACILYPSSQHGNCCSDRWCCHHENGMWPDTYSCKSSC